jgi:hypothetical protein
MSRTSALLIAASIALSFAGAPPSAHADDLVPAKVLVRKFPQGVFCALPISMSFTAPSTPVTITFTAAEWVDDGAGGLAWTQQLIDNVSVSPTAQVAANFDPPPAGSNWEFCYIGDPLPTPYYHFNRSGLELDLLERFDTNPAARGWGLAAGGYYVPASSAPRNVEDCTDATGGSLGLGDGSGTPSASATASSSVTLSSLHAGTSYDLGAWWYAGFVHFPHDVNYLTVSITTTGGTPIAQRSWGALKSAYR